MWDLLKQTDIEQAKQELKFRRCETLRRHAEESQILDADQAELKTLNRLIDDFVRKFIKFRTSSQVLVSTPVANRNISAATPPDVRYQNHRDQPRTNFDTFARAVARG